MIIVYSAYKNERYHRYYGRLLKKSSVRIGISNSGHWHVAIDIQGLVGNSRASVRILPSPLPEIKVAPLTYVPNLINNIPAEILIIYLFPMLLKMKSNELIAEALNVWSDKIFFKISDSLRQKID